MFVKVSGLGRASTRMGRGLRGLGDTPSISVPTPIGNLPYQGVTQTGMSPFIQQLQPQLLALARAGQDSSKTGYGLTTVNNWNNLYRQLTGNTISQNLAYQIAANVFGFSIVPVTDANMATVPVQVTTYTGALDAALNGPQWVTSSPEIPAAVPSRGALFLPLPPGTYPLQPSPGGSPGGPPAAVVPSAPLAPSSSSAPSQLVAGMSQPVSVLGYSVPLWGIGAAVLGLLFVFGSSGKGR